MYRIALGGITLAGRSWQNQSLLLFQFGMRAVLWKFEHFIMVDEIIALESCG
jgi:hypothetical protein